MKHLHCYIVSPLNGRYSNKKKIQDKELILNTSIEDHKFVNRIGTIIETPINGSILKKGDLVIVHHNVFRRFYDVRGNEKNSSSYFQEDKYFCYYDQIFLYKRNNKWNTPDGFNFVKPVSENDMYSLDKEKPLTGYLKYLSPHLRALNLKENDLIGFTENSEYEFVFEGERLYRVQDNSIAINYGANKNEIEYNPSWV
jgi:hypothetical protein